MTKAIALLAGLLLSFAALSPSPSMAQSDADARLKSLEDRAKMNSGAGVEAQDSAITNINS